MEMALYFIYIWNSFCTWIVWYECGRWLLCVCECPCMNVCNLRVSGCVRLCKMAVNPFGNHSTTDAPILCPSAWVFPFSFYTIYLYFIQFLLSSIRIYLFLFAWYDTIVFVGGENEWDKRLWVKFEWVLFVYNDLYMCVCINMSKTSIAIHFPRN